MNNTIKILMQKGYLSESDFGNNKNYLNKLFSKFFENIGRALLVLFVFLFFVASVASLITVTMPILVIVSFFWLKKSPKHFFPPIVLTSTLLVSIGIYSDYVNIDTSIYFLIAFILHNIYCFFFKNLHMQKIYLPVFYTFLLMLPMEDFISYSNYLLIVSIINFIFIILLIIKEEHLRKFNLKSMYLPFLVESLFLALGISLWYEWLNIMNIFYEGEKGIGFTRGNTLLYILGNAYILYLLKKQNLIKINTLIINILLAFISIQIPFVSFALFLFNLSLYREWFLLSKLSLGLIVISLFLLYHSISTSFIIKSISTFVLGLIMIGTFIYMKRKGVNND